jgi:hypothetical protein
MVPQCRPPSAGSAAGWPAVISPRIRWHLRRNCREIAGKLPGKCPAISGHRAGQCPGSFRRNAAGHPPSWPRPVPVIRPSASRLMPVTDPNSIRQAAAEFQPCRRPRFQNLQPWREVIMELRWKGASCEAIAGLLTRHGVKTSRTMVNEFVWTLPQPKVNRRRKPRRKLVAAPPLPSPAPPPIASAPVPEPLPIVPEKIRGPRIAQVRMLKPQNS